MIESRTVGASVIFAILNKELQLIMDTSNGLDAILHKILIALKIFKIRQKNKKFDFFMWLLLKSDQEQKIRFLPVWFLWPHYNSGTVRDFWNPIEKRWQEFFYEE